MTSMEFILSVISAEGGNVEGRTLLQKLVYFTHVISGVDANLAFDAHFYGPFSATVESTIARLRDAGLIEEQVSSFGEYSRGFEVKRYDYKLTKDGETLLQRVRLNEDYQRIEGAVQRINSQGKLDYMSLSFAAKVYYILTRRKAPMTQEEICSQASTLNWEISQATTDKAIRFLTDVGLALPSH
jgi:uncharacterized protein YwgA